MRVVLVIFLLSIIAAQAQDSSGLSNYEYQDFRSLDTNYKKRYSFVHYERNHFAFYSKDSRNFRDLYAKLERLSTSNEGKLNFYHIGGSHIQADIYTHDFRTQLQTMWKGAGGERGWVFPFKLAETNNPINYSFTSLNNWRGYRCVNHKPASYDFDYGLLGAAITCPDSVITIQFKHHKTISKPSFNHIRIFHNVGEFAYWMHLGAQDMLIDRSEHDPVLGCTDIYLSDYVDSLDIQFQRTGEQAPELEIHSFLLMNDEPGISYTSIGINGAALFTYLKNVRFEEQLKTYPPDFFAFSVGTNDGNVPYDRFNPQVYMDNLEKMMQMVLRANPKCAILLTVPNDSYYHKKYLNKNIARERTGIIELARRYDMAVWDLYGIMGELGSSKTWRNNRLIQRDLVHFTRAGYHFKAELYYDAFLKYLDQMKATD